MSWIQRQTQRVVSGAQTVGQAVTSGAKNVVKKITTPSTPTSSVVGTGAQQPTPTTTSTPIINLQSSPQYVVSGIPSSVTSSSTRTTTPTTKTTTTKPTTQPQYVVSGIPSSVTSSSTRTTSTSSTPSTTIKYTPEVEKVLKDKGTLVVDPKKESVSFREPQISSFTAKTTTSSSTKPQEKKPSILLEVAKRSSPFTSLSTIGAKAISSVTRKKDETQKTSDFDYLKDVKFSATLPYEDKISDQGTMVPSDIKFGYEDFAKQKLDETQAKITLGLGTKDGEFDPKSLVFGGAGVTTAVRKEYESDLKSTGLDKFKRLFGGDKVKEKKLVADAERKTEQATWAASTLLESKQREAEQTIQHLNPILEEYSSTARVLEEKGESLTQRDKQLMEMQQNIEQTKKQLEQQSDTVDLYDASAVEAYNRSIQRLDSDIENFNKQIELSQSEWKNYETQFKDLQNVYDTTIIPASTKLEGIEKEQDKLLDLIYSMPGAKEDVVDKIKSRDWLYEKRKDADDTTRRISEDLSWKDDFGTKLTAKTLSGVESVGLGALETFRSVGTFLSSPARIAKRDKELGIESKPLDVIMPLKSYARGIYDWKDPTKDRYKTSTLLDTTSIKGAVSTALIGLGGAKGAVSGVKPTAIKVASRTAKTLSAVGTGLLVGGAVTAPAVMERRSSKKEIKLIEKEISDLNNKLSKGEITQKQYNKTQQFLEERLQSAKSREVTGGVVVNRILGTTGEVATTMAGALTAAKLATPKSTIVSGSKIKGDFSYGITAKSKGGELGGGLTAKGVKIPEVSLPKSAPGIKTMKLDVTEKLGGFKNIGKTVKTQYKFYPGKDGVGESIIRTRDFGFQKEITTQIAGKQKATTVVMSPEGKVLRTLSTKPMKVDDALLATTKIIKEQKLYDPQRIQIGDNEIFQQVGKAGQFKMKIDMPGAKVTGKGFMTSEAGKYSKAAPSIIKTKTTGEQIFYPQEAKMVSKPLKGKWTTDVVQPKLQIGDARSEQLYGLTSDQKLRLGDVGFTQKGSKLVPFEQRFTDTILTQKQPVTNIMATDIKGKFELTYQPKTFFDDTLKPLFYRSSNVGVNTLDKLKQPLKGKQAQFDLNQILVIEKKPTTITTSFNPQQQLVKKAVPDTRTFDTGRLVTQQKTKVITQQPQTIQTTGALKTVQLPKQINIPLKTVLTKPALTSSLLAPTLISTSLSTGLASVLDSKQTTASKSQLGLGMAMQPTYTSSLESSLVSTTRLDSSLVQQKKLDTSTLSPLNLSPIFATTSLTSPSLFIPKIPLIALGGGGLGGSGGRPKVRARSDSWLVSNKIADFAGDWAKRQQEKPNIMLGGLSTKKENKISWL